MAASSSSPVWKYDVFLSFRGEDTRKNIVSHLHKELVNRGILTFKDDKRLEMGDFISGELSRAIKESRFAVVILSKNYASSRWCLDELLIIMDLHLKKKMKVIPIFYGVDPSHVRHQNESFTLEKYHGPEMANKVINWSEALTQIASIAGKDSATCENEALMIEDIVEGISNQLFVMKSVDFSDIVGMDDHMERLNALLSMESESEVRMIGIWGMGGIGKTTIARCLFDRFSRLFPVRCFLENVSKIVREHDVSYLREKFFSATICLSEKSMKFSSVELGPQEIKARFGHRKVLVVLDNVDDMKQVHALTKESGWFGPGSRIIITTRDKGLLDSSRVRRVYEVKCLDAGAALQIFNQFAFEERVPPSESIEKLSIQVSRLAQGLPAAIEAYGLYFRKMTSLNEWENALRRFIRVPITKVMEILKISYDGLDEADKSVFLHVACLFNGESLRRATNLLDDDELYGCLGVRTLAEKSLIEITADGHIEMHHLVEQTAREVVRQEYSLRPQGRRVLWDPSEVYVLLKWNMGNEPIQCLALHMCDMSSPLNLEGYMKKKTTNLKFLKVYKHLDQTETKLQMSSDDTNLLSTRLRLLHWDAFSRTAFSSRFQPQSLVDVSLRYSNLRSFWTGPVGLLKLRRLDCSGSKNLELLPDLSMAVHLEELITQGCKRLKGIPESISNLTGLKKLDISYCDDLKSYQITIRELTRARRQIALYFSGNEMEMESMADLSIGGDIHIKMLWLDGKADHICFSSEQQGRHTKPMFLGLESPTRTERDIKAMPEFHGREWMIKLDQPVHHDQPAPEVSMRTSEAVQSTPVFHGQQKPRTTSEYHGFNSIDIIRFKYNSNAASFLCYSLSMFPCLKVLNLINLNIEVIPDDICSLQLLEKLDWSGNDFESLPETMNQLPKLKHASLCNCSRLIALPELVQLETVKLSGCTNLQPLIFISHGEPDWGRFRLFELWLDDCKNIQSISDQLGHLIKLTYLNLSSNDFETLPSSIAELSSLRTLCLSKCKKLKSIKGVPLSLKHLYAHGCDILETVSLPLNHSIKHLDISQCFCLKQYEHLITQFLKEGLNEEDSPRFACFPGTEVPNYFANIWEGDSHTIGLPWPSPKLLGFDGCIVVACESPFHIQFLPLSFDWDWADQWYFCFHLQPEFFHCRHSSFLTAEEEAAVTSDHLVIIRGIKNISKEIYKFGIQTYLQFKSSSVKIKSTGFSLIWEDDITDEMETRKGEWPLHSLLSTNLKS